MRCTKMQRLVPWLIALRRNEIDVRGWTCASWGHDQLAVLQESWESVSGVHVVGEQYLEGRSSRRLNFLPTVTFEIDSMYFDPREKNKCSSQDEDGAHRNKPFHLQKAKSSTKACPRFTDSIGSRHCRYWDRSLQHSSELEKYKLKYLYISSCQAL